eukprot:EG_transcript_1084
MEDEISRLERTPSDPLECLTSGLYSVQELEAVAAEVRQATATAEAAAFQATLWHFKESYVAFCEQAVRGLLIQEIEVDYLQTMATLEAPRVLWLEEPVARLAVQEEETHARERLFARRFADQEWLKVLEARRVQQELFLRDEEEARQTVLEAEEGWGRVLRLQSRELVGRRAIVRLEEVAWGTALHRLRCAGELQLLQREARAGIEAEALASLLALAETMHRKLVAHAEEHGWYRLQRTAPPGRRFAQADIRLTELLAEEAFDRLCAAREEEVRFGALRQLAKEDWKGLLVRQPDWYRRHATDQRHLHQQMLAQSLAYHLSHEAVEAEWREANVTTAALVDTLANLQLQETAQRALVEATQTRERSALVLQAVLARSDPESLPRAQAEAERLLEQRAAAQAEMQAGVLAAYPFLAVAPLSPAHTARPAARPHLWPFTYLDPAVEEAEVAAAGADREEQLRAASSAVPLAAAAPLPSDTYYALAQLNPAALRQLSRQELADAVARDEARERYLRLREEALGYRSIVAARQETLRLFARFQLLQRSLPLRAALQEEEQRAFAALCAAHSHALMPLLDVAQRAERQRIGRMQAQERELLCFRFAEARAKAEGRQRTRGGLLLQRFARAWLSSAEAARQRDVRHQQLLQWAYVMAQVRDALDVYLHEYMDGVQALEAEEAQRRAHLQRHYATSTAEAFSRDRVRLLKEEAGRRLGLMAVEVQERSAISLHSETVLMELALSVNMRQEIDHLWAQQLVACSLLLKEEEEEYEHVSHLAQTSHQQARQRQTQRLAREDYERGLARLLRRELTVRAELVVLQEQVFADLILRARDGVLRRSALARELRFVGDRETRSRQVVVAEEASERLALQRHFELGGLTRCWEGAARRRHAVDRQCAEERAGMVSDMIELLKRQVAVEESVMAERARHVTIPAEARRRFAVGVEGTALFLGRLQGWLALFGHHFVAGVYQAKHHAAAIQIQRVVRGAAARRRGCRLQQHAARRRHRQRCVELLRQEELREQAEMFAADACSLHWHRRQQQAQLAGQTPSPLFPLEGRGDGGLAGGLFTDSPLIRGPLSAMDPPGAPDQFPASPFASPEKAVPFTFTDVSPTATIAVPEAERARITRLCRALLGGLHGTLAADVEWSTAARALQPRLPPLAAPPPAP